MKKHLNLEVFPHLTPVPHIGLARSMWRLLGAVCPFPFGNEVPLHVSLFLTAWCTPTLRDIFIVLSRGGHFLSLVGNPRFYHEKHFPSHLPHATSSLKWELFGGISVLSCSKAQSRFLSAETPVTWWVCHWLPAFGLPWGILFGSVEKIDSLIPCPHAGALLLFLHRWGSCRQEGLVSARAAPGWLWCGGSGHTAVGRGGDQWRGVQQHGPGRGQCVMMKILTQKSWHTDVLHLTL